MDTEVKLPDTGTTIHPLLAARWSPRAFAGKAVEKDKLKKLFEAARWAPSSANEQPWRFMLGIKEDSTWQKIFSCLDDGNQRWCKDAPVLVLNVAKKSGRSGRENPYRAHDVGQAAAHLTFQAMAEGLYVHQMAGFYKEKAREVFAIPDDYEPFTCIAIGYLGEPEMLPEDLAAREVQPRHRKPLSETVFGEGWDSAFDF